MSNQKPLLMERIKSWISTAADLLTIVTLLAGTATAAFVSNLVDSHRLSRLFVVVSAALVAALLTRVGFRIVQRVRYRFWSNTTVELHGGNSLTLVIRHAGLPVKVRARAQFAEFGEDMESHPAPFDLQLFTRAYGGRFELIELNDSFDAATSVFGQLERLARDAARFSVERAGLSSFVAVSSDASAVLAYLNITVRVITPFGATSIAKQYRLFVSNQRIVVVDDTER